MMPSLLPPMSMTTLSRWTATTVPWTISPSLPKSPAVMLASKRDAKLSAPLGSGDLPAELRAVVVSGDIGGDWTSEAASRRAPGISWDDAAVDLAEPPIAHQRAGEGPRKERPQRRTSP